MNVTPIEYQDTFNLRQRVMNPEKSISEMYRQGDEEASHFGIKQSDRLIGVISLYPQRQDTKYSTSVWRIRGMAVDQEFQRQGLGKILFQEALEHLKQDYSIDTIWCNSRENAVGFYKNLGFEIIGSTYLTEPSPGTRYRMIFKIN